MKKSELKQIIKEEISNVLSEESDTYSTDVLKIVDGLAKKLNLGSGFNQKYWEWFSGTEDFKDMIETAKLNQQSPSSAAKSIISLWR